MQRNTKQKYDDKTKNDYRYFFMVTITEDEEIDIHTFFGGIEIIVPTTVNVEVKSQNFIGGVDIKN